MFSMAVLSVFVLVGKAIRVRVRFIQEVFLPPSILGGFLALFLGPFVLGWMPEAILDDWSSLPGDLISVVLATLFLGMPVPGPKKLWALGGAQLCYGTVAGIGQYLVALLVVTLLLTPLFGVSPIFACIVEIGFSGGHGTAAGMTPVFEKFGFPAGGALAQMSATVGIVSSVTVGIVLVNYAARKGYASNLRADKGIAEHKKTGLIPPSKRYPLTTATVAPEAIEPLAFHAAIVGLAILLGYGLLAGVHRIDPVLETFPLFPLAMVGGLLIQAVATPTGLASYFDRGTFDRILGIALDVLVVTAIATLRLDLFLVNFWPFAIIMTTGIGWMLFSTMVIAPRMLPDHWFERGITEFGMQTGVTAMGLLLLKLVDPEYKTGTANAFGFKQVIYEPFLGGGLITALGPTIIMTLGVWQSIGACLVVMVAFAGLAASRGWVNLRPNMKATQPVTSPSQ